MAGRVIVTFPTNMSIRWLEIGWIFFLPTVLQTIIGVEIHDGKRPLVGVNDTACRQEDGLYKCQQHGDMPQIKCVRRTHVGRSCDDKDEIMKLNCTDDEQTCKYGGCVKRYDINTKWGCDLESRKFHIRCHSSEEFECKISKLCLPRHWVRNGAADCSIDGEINDTSDEDEALASCHPDTEFRCQDRTGRCIPREMVMDGRPDCADSSDEKHQLNCHNSTEFRCESGGRCIARYRVNDGFPDCASSSDEDVTVFRCRDDTEFDCGDGRCIPRSWVGNSLVDCKSGVDERTQLGECREGEFMCRDESRCLPLRYLCDGIANCDDCSDEVELCDEPRRFRCHSEPSVCLPWTRTCDGIDDCGDESDERTGSAMKGFKCEHHNRTCHVPQFLLTTHTSMCDDFDDRCYDNAGSFQCARCLDGTTVISTSQVCDGRLDCHDLSDECPCQDSRTRPLCERVFPPGHECGGERRPNLAEIRTHLPKICDGVADWGDGLDEEFCHRQPGPVHHADHTNYECLNLTNHLPPLGGSRLKFSATKCDGRIECLGFDDECSGDCDVIDRRCEVFAAATDNSLLVRVCPDTDDVIIPQWLCDGVRYCPGGEDELDCPGRFYCDAGEVVSVDRRQVCDLRPHCHDASDEADCPDSTHFYCDSQFIDARKVGDGKADCSDFSDECPLELFRQNPFSSPAELLDSVLLRFLIWSFAITAVSGNVCVITSTLRQLKQISNKNSSKYSNRMLIVHLASADLLAGVSLLILLAKSLQFSGEFCLHDKEWKMGVSCTLIGTILVVSAQTSLNIIVALTALRLMSVVHPMKSKRLNRRLYHLLALFSWIISIFIAFWPVFNMTKLETLLQVEKNAYFINTTITHQAFDEYQDITNVIYKLHNGNDSNLVLASNALHFLNGTIELFPERYVQIQGTHSYYSESNVCFPNYFGAPLSESYISLCIVVYNTALLLFILASYIVFYQKASAETIATPASSRSIVHRKSNLKKRISVLVLTTFLCWFPICALAYCNLAINHFPNRANAFAAVVLLPIDSCINPILYAEVHKKVFRFVKTLSRINRTEDSSL